MRELRLQNQLLDTMDKLLHWASLIEKDDGNSNAIPTWMRNEAHKIDLVVNSKL